MHAVMLPPLLLKSLEGMPGFNRAAFLNVHASGEQVVSVRLNPRKIPDLSLFPGSLPVPWSTHGYYLPSRPAFIFDPFLHAGGYYVQEASSMFLEQCIQQTTDTSRSLRVLDLCAAPGGKSTLIQSMLNNQSLLISNEVIKSRVSVLKENLTKWGGVNKIVTNSDPRDFSALKNYFDLIVVDAPCSGSGLFRKDPLAISQWSPELVDMCRQRQERILADVYPALRNGGVLIYSTCSYSPEENEQVAEWLCNNFQLDPLRIAVDAETGIVEGVSDKKEIYGYRFFPDRLKGEGFFICCFRKKDGEDQPTVKPGKNKLSTLTGAQRASVAPWLDNSSPVMLFEHNQEIFAFPDQFASDIAQLTAWLYFKEAGTDIGKLIRDQLLPAHALVLSGILSQQAVRISLKKDEALQYLRKEEVNLSTPVKGWAVVEYGGLGLGWIKILHNRINNYYPKEWRILKSGVG